MSGSRTKKLRAKAYAVYMMKYRGNVPFKSVFRHIKKLYNARLGMV